MIIFHEDRMTTSKNLGLVTPSPPGLTPMIHSVHMRAKSSIVYWMKDYKDWGGLSWHSRNWDLLHKGN